MLAEDRGNAYTYHREPPSFKGNIAHGLSSLREWDSAVEDTEVFETNTLEEFASTDLNGLFERKRSTAYGRPVSDEQADTDQISPSGSKRYRTGDDDESERQNSHKKSRLDYRSVYHIIPQVCTQSVLNQSIFTI